MTVKNEMSFWVICDGCGARPDDDGFDVLHDSPEKAIEWASGGDWFDVGEGRHACGRCVDWNDGDPILRTPDDNVRHSAVTPDGEQSLWDLPAFGVRGPEASGSEGSA